MERCRLVAAAPGEPRRGAGQRARRGGGRRPVGDVADFRGRWRVCFRDGSCAAAGPCAGTADADGRGRGGHAGGGEPRASRDHVSGAAYDLRGGRVRRGGGLAGGGLAAGAVGPLGPAAGDIGRCRRGAINSGDLVRRRADHRRRAGRPGGTHLRRRAGAVAAGGGRLLPSCRQEGHHTQPEPRYFAAYPVALSGTIRTTTRTAPGRSSPGSRPSYFHDNRVSSWRPGSGVMDTRPRSST